MWNVVATMVPVVSLVAGSGSAAHAPARLRIQPVTVAREIGVTASGIAKAARTGGWGTVGGSYGLAFGSAAVVEGTLDLTGSEGYIGSLATARLLLRSMTPSGEHYAIMGAATSNIRGLRGRGAVLGAGARGEIRDGLDLVGELQVLVLNRNTLSTTLAPRIVFGVRIRRD